MKCAVRTKYEYSRWPKSAVMEKPLVLAVSVIGLILVVRNSSRFAWIEREICCPLGINSRIESSGFSLRNKKLNAEVVLRTI